MIYVWQFFCLYEVIPTYDNAMTVSPLWTERYDMTYDIPRAHWHDVWQDFVWDTYTLAYDTPYGAWYRQNDLRYDVPYTKPYTGAYALNCRYALSYDN
jgi:hypothetical protein